ncbi:Endonuclease/exonuclease/phosphatase [Penicillium brevicompactum]
MLETNLRALQLNIMKSGPKMEALINDHQSQNLDVLLIQEPSITTYRTHVNHSSWRLYHPTTETDAAQFRSLIYVNHNLSTSAHQQIPCDHPDVAAIKIWTSNSQILFFSIYTPSIPLCTDTEASAEPTLTAIQNTITTALQDNQQPTNIILSGDFNRHHPMWGGNHIQPQFIEDASDLITFFQANATQGGITIDQTVKDRPELLIKCHLYHENYGSDHRATYSKWNLQTHSKRTTQTRKAYERADWNKIGKEVTQRIGPWKEIKTRLALDEAVQNLTEATTASVNKFTPDTHPTPYSKRWFTPDLKVQQTKVNQLHRRWQENCGMLGRDHPHSTTAFQEMQQSRRAWTQTIEKAKASHWRRFLDEAGERKLWKAATYMKPRESWRYVPTLQVDDQELIENEDKAQAFLDSFFPQMDTPEANSTTLAPLGLPWQPLITSEIERSLKAAKGTTAPGEDKLPMLMWKQLWVHLKDNITRIFNVLLSLGYHPKQWRNAKIVVLRKPGKPDYSLPGAYHPISLLNTLGKLLEVVIAQRLSYLAEKHRLLPDTQFGGRPGRTTEQALLVLSNAIDRPWYKHKVVTLVSFDLKGPFNRV